MIYEINKDTGFAKASQLTEIEKELGMQKTNYGVKFGKYFQALYRMDKIEGLFLIVRKGLIYETMKADAELIKNKSINFVTDEYDTDIDGYHGQICYTVGAYETDGDVYLIVDAEFEVDREYDRDDGIGRYECHGFVGYDGGCGEYLASVTVDKISVDYRFEDENDNVLTEEEVAIRLGITADELKTLSVKDLATSSINSYLEEHKEDYEIEED